jgi:hypothetical protein
MMQTATISASIWKGKFSCIVKDVNEAAYQGVVELSSFRRGNMQLWFGRACIPVGLPFPDIYGRKLLLEIEDGPSIAVHAYNEIPLGNVTLGSSAGVDYYFDFLVFSDLRQLIGLPMKEAAAARTIVENAQCWLVDSRQLIGRGSLFTFTDRESGELPALSLSFAKFALLEGFSFPNGRAIEFEGGVRGKFDAIYHCHDRSFNCVAVS